MKPTPPAPVNAASQGFSHRYLGAGLTLLAVAIAGCAGVIWANSFNEVQPVQAATSDTRAWALLGRGLHADNKISFSAHVETIVFIGARGLQSEAQLVRAPQHLAISYLSGPMKGQKSGFSERCFWRQNTQGKLVPYAHTTHRAAAMTERRFELMRANYQAHLQAPRVILGRPVEVVELRPMRPLQGMRGPAKRVFIDAKTALTVRTESFNSRLQPVSHSTFSQFNLHPDIIETTFHSPAAITAAAHQSFWQGEELGEDAHAVALKAGIEPPQSSEIPRGWARDGFGVHRSDGPNQTLQIAAFTRYTDGLNVLTLFAMKQMPVVPPDVNADVSDLTKRDLEREPTPTAYNCSFGPGTLVSRTDGAGVLLAIGDLPTEILQSVLDNAHFKVAVIATPTLAPTPSATTPSATPKL